MQSAPEHQPNQSALDYLDGFIDESKAADFLCQSVRTIQKWRVTGFGPSFFKSGRSIRYRRRELMEWAETRRRSSTSAIDAWLLPVRAWLHRTGFWGRLASDRRGVKWHSALVT